MNKLWYKLVIDISDEDREKTSKDDGVAFRYREKNIFLRLLFLFNGRILVRVKPKADFTNTSGDLGYTIANYIKCKICQKNEVQNNHSVCAECSTSGQEY